MSNNETKFTTEYGRKRHEEKATLDAAHAAKEDAERDCRVAIIGIQLAEGRTDECKHYATDRFASYLTLLMHDRCYHNIKLCNLCAEDWFHYDRVTTCKHNALLEQKAAAEKKEREDAILDVRRLLQQAVEQRIKL